MLPPHHPWSRSCATARSSRAPRSATTRYVGDILASRGATATEGRRTSWLLYDITAAATADGVPRLASPAGPRDSTSRYAWPAE